MGVASTRSLANTRKVIELRPARIRGDREVLECLCHFSIDPFGPFSHSFQVGESRSCLPMRQSDPEGLIGHRIDEVDDHGAQRVCCTVCPETVFGGWINELRVPSTDSDVIILQQGGSARRF